MRKNLAIAVAGLGLIVSAAPVWAHHAFAAEFDSTKPLKLQRRGDQDGMDQSARLDPHRRKESRRHGDQLDGGRWKPEHFAAKWFYQELAAAGTEIVVDGYQSKDESNKMNGRDITFPDGRKLFVGSAGTGAPPDKAEK